MSENFVENPVDRLGAQRQSFDLNHGVRLHGIGMENEVDQPPVALEVEAGDVVGPSGSGTSWPPEQ